MSTATISTTRCTLPLPIGAPEQERITVMMSDLIETVPSDELIPGSKDFLLAEIEICLGTEGYYPTTRFIGERKTTLLESDGGTVIFPSLSVAVAHLMLGNFSAEYLGLTDPCAAAWHDAKQMVRERSLARLEEPLEAWQARPEAERGDILSADDAATLKAACHACLVLELICMERARQKFRVLLAASRPFDPEHYRYLDGAREYSDGSGGTDQAA